MKVFDIFEVCEARPYSEPDSEYSYRAMVSYVHPDGLKVKSLFPPTQLRAFNTKYDFTYFLNQHLDVLKSLNYKVLQVDVEVGGKPDYSIEIDQ